MVCFVGGDAVWSSWFREDHLGSRNSKACWVQCGGNQCQVGQTEVNHITLVNCNPLVVTPLLSFCSDDRSAEVFQKRIDTATQMKSVLGANERPNCLIIDEIDGAPTVCH